jgi:ankyrin repeat protein
MYPDRPPRIVDIHARDSSGDTPLHKVALWGDNYAVGELLSAGAQVDALGDMGCTPLYFATMNSHVLAAATLLHHGANPDIRSELGFTPAEVAAHSNSADLKKLFRDVKPNPRLERP